MANQKKIAPVMDGLQKPNSLAPVKEHAEDQKLRLAMASASGVSRFATGRYETISSEVMSR